MLTVLNAGAGNAPLPHLLYPKSEWTEIRLDADERSRHDLLGDVRNIPLADESVDGVFNCHVLEHLCEQDGRRALREFHRVLKPEGELVLLTPDLKAVAKEILANKLLDTLYESPAGPVRPVDVIYGFQPLQQTHPLFAHRFGFTLDSLAHAVAGAGFDTEVTEILNAYELRAIGRKPRSHERHPNHHQNGSAAADQ